MDINSLIISLVIGAIAGYLAGLIVKGYGLGILGNIVVGIVGAAIFSFLFGNFNLFNSAIVNQISGATIGAVILLFAVGLIRR